MGYRVKRLQDFARGMRESRRLLERERWPRARIESFQRERLAELTRYAAERAPVWRERVAPGTTEPTDLPVLTKARLMEDFDVVTADPDVREFQVVQRGDALRLRVALREGAVRAPERLRERLASRLEALGVAHPWVEVERVEALERGEGGKLTLIVPDREARSPGPARVAG
jgi:phenylacetate-coenzyme A ligase PaaK-like adenylate-forming protein